MTPLDENLLDLIDHPVFVLHPDAGGGPIFGAVNQGFCRVVDRPKDDILGRSAAQVFPGRTGQVVFAHHMAALSSGQPRTYEVLLPMVQHQGLMRTTLRPDRDANGQVSRLVGSSIDLSGRRVSGELQGDGVVPTSEIEHFVSLAAHDLRAPIRHVIQISDLLADDFEDLGDGKKEMVKMLNDIGHKTMVLIDDVLSHAQATSSAKQEVEFEFSELVQELASILDLRSEVSIQSQEARLSADRTVIQIVLRNLIENAIKYVHPCDGAGPADLRASQLGLSAAVRDAGDGFIAVSLRDNGFGFSDPAILFLAGGTAGIKSGFGLLGIRRLIRARGGTLTVANQTSARGAEITFTLPGALSRDGMGIRAIA